MKKLILLFVFLSQVVYGQLTNSIYPEAPYSDLQQIAVEGDNIFTSGDCDVMMVSQNGGADWTTIEMDDSVINLAIVPGSNGDKCFYMTKDDLFILDITTKQFEKVSDSALVLAAGRFRSLVAGGDKVYVISGGAIFESPVNNYAWTKLADIGLNNNDDYVNKSAITESFIFIGSHMGEIRRVNFTTGVVEAMFDFGNRISDLEMVNDNLGYADVNSQSSFVKTTNGGAAWSNVQGMPENISPIAYGDNVIISVNTNRLYVSMDGGATSTYVPMPEDGFTDLVSAAFMTDDGKLYLSGRSSMVLRTDDFASSFVNLNKYKRADLRAIHINSGGTGYAVGANGSVIKTETSGESWEAVDLGFSTDAYLSGIASYADGRVIIAHDMGLAIYQDDVLVEDLGLSTDVLFQSRNSDVLIALQASSGSNAIAVSSDRGATWENKAMVPSSYYKINQSPTGKIYIPNGENIVYTSIDEGNTWEIEEFGLTGISQVSFLDDDNGIIAANGKLYKTTDAGVNALEIASGYALGNIHYFNEDKMMFTTAQNGNTNIRVSENGGSSFSSEPGYCITTSGSYFDGSQTIWLAMRGGHINKYVFETLPSSTQNVTSSSLEFYPNPIRVGQSLLINDIPSSGAELIIASLTGQKMISHDVIPEDKISTEGLVPGCYMISVRSGKERWIGKLIIQ